MSSEVGGTIFGVLLAAAVAGPVIAAAIAVLVTGAAIAAATTVAVAVVKGVQYGVNGIVEMHKKKVQESINSQQDIAEKNGNALASKIAEERKNLLEVYSASSDNIKTISDELETSRKEISSYAKDIKVKTAAELEYLQSKVNSLNCESEAKLNAHISSLTKDVESKARKWKEENRKYLDERKKTYEKAISELEKLVLPDKEIVEFVNKLIDEGEEVYRQLQSETDWEELLPGRKAVLDDLKSECYKLKGIKQYESAIIAVNAFEQKIMESYIELDSERHKRELIQEQINLDIAELQVLVDNCSEIKVNDKATLTSNADYWANGRLNPILEEGKKLCSEAVEASKLSVADLERFMQKVSETTAELRDMANLSRQAYACAYMRMKMLPQVKNAFKACGWVCDGWGFEDSDYRQPLCVRFSRDGKKTKADLLLSPVFNETTKCYDIDVTIERFDAGMVDEQLRTCQLASIQKNLKEQNVPTHSLKCKKGTEGKNSIGPITDNRFSVPSNR